MIRSAPSAERSVAGGFRFSFRVSDALVVPLRGYLLRLRLVDGHPNLNELRPGRKLLVSAPDGERRVVRIKDLSITGGRATRERLEATHELDIVISEGDAARNDRRIAMGWTASGPVEAGQEEAA